MKKKGFTLVELLAVIVIVALVALIATPIILNVIKDSKKQAIKQSAIGYVDAVEKKIVVEKTKQEDIDYTGDYTVSKNKITKSSETASLLPVLDIISLNINVKGTLPDSGKLTIGNKGVTSGKFYYGNYLVTLNNGDYNIQILNDTNNVDTSALEEKINNLKTELDAEKKKGATIYLDFLGSTDLSCNSTNNRFEALTKNSKTSDSDDIFSYSNGGIIINKTGYYSISTYAFFSGTRWINIGVSINDSTISMQSFYFETTSSPGSSASYIGKLQKNDVIKQSYWCNGNYTMQYANLAISYLHDA